MASAASDGSSKADGRSVGGGLAALGSSSNEGNLGGNVASFGYSSPYPENSSSSAVLSDVSSMSTADMHAHLMQLQQDGAPLHGNVQLLQTLQNHFPTPESAVAHHQHLLQVNQSSALNDASSSSSSSQRHQASPSLYDFNNTDPGMFSSLHQSNHHQISGFDAQVVSEPPSRMQYQQQFSSPHASQPQQSHQQHLHQNAPTFMQDSDHMQQIHDLQHHSMHSSTRNNQQEQHSYGVRAQNRHGTFGGSNSGETNSIQMNGTGTAGSVGSASEMRGSLTDEQSSNHFSSPRHGLLPNTSTQQADLAHVNPSSNAESDIITQLQHRGMQQQVGMVGYEPRQFDSNGQMSFAVPPVSYGAQIPFGHQRHAGQIDSNESASHQDLWSPYQQQPQDPHSMAAHRQIQPSPRSVAPSSSQLDHIRALRQSPHQSYDFTDHSLSAALASNAQISSSSSVDAFRRQSQQGNTTPTIMEEDEQGFQRHQQQTFATHHPHYQSQMSLQQQHRHHQNIPQAQMQQSMMFPSLSVSQGPSDVLQDPSSASVIVNRRSRPNLRPTFYQQYSTIDMSSMEEQRLRNTEDCLPFIDEVMFNYLATPSRLGLGERTVMVMASKVAQKSYGAEKRFLCPPPMVLLVGSSWWSACRPPSANASSQAFGADELMPTVLTPPRLSISMSGDGAAPAQDGILEWASSSGKLIDTDNPSSEFAISGRSIGRQLFINDSDEKRRHCEASIQITVPAAVASERRLLGVFASKPIKVISKPSKKRQSTRNSELGVNHGSTISLFHRLRSQTVSTRYLCVSGAPTWFKGSDGIPFLNNDADTHIPKQGESPSCFVAKTSSWDPFVVYLVHPHMSAKDPSQAKSEGKHSAASDGRPAHYPSPPANTLPFAHGNTPIHYNQPIVLQCLNTAVVSPVMVIRKADRGTTVAGGGQPLAPFGPNGPPPGDTYGEPVSQLHRVAFEVLDVNASQDSLGAQADQSGPGQSGHFLGCLNEDVGLRMPLSVRQWAIPPMSSGQGGAGVGIGGRGSSQSRPTTPTTPITPMTNQVPSSSSFSQIDVGGGPGVGGAVGRGANGFKFDQTMSPTSMAAAFALSQSNTGTGAHGGGARVGNLSMQQQQAASSYPYTASGIPTGVGQAAYHDESSDGGKVKRPRRVSSSSLVPQKDRAGSTSKNRRRGQSLSVVGLQNQLYAQQQQKEQQQLQNVAAQASGSSGSMYAASGLYPGKSPSSSSLTSAMSSQHGAPPGGFLRRTSSFANSLTNSEASSFSVPPANVGALAWTVEVHDSDIWTIVGVDIARHTFYLPPALVGGSKAKAAGVDESIAHLVTVPAPATPITPLPIVYKYTSSSANGSKNGGVGSGSGSIGALDGGQGYVTLIGANLMPDLFVYFGEWRSTHVNVANTNTIFCAAPPPLDDVGLPRDLVPITLVRRDGVIFPTDCIYHPPSV